MAIVAKDFAGLPIQCVDIATANLNAFERRCVGCLVVTCDNKILLQQRDLDCKTYPGCIATFGGGIEPGETPMMALVRELHEELGAVVNPREVITLGAITEWNVAPSELVYCYFWRDTQQTITGCYEGALLYFNHYSDVMAKPGVMNDVLWLLSRYTG